MAQNLGFLNFGIDGDDKALKAKLEALKKDAVSIEQIFKNIKLDSGGSKLSTDVQKAQLSADKLAVSAGKVAEQTKKIEKVTEQVNTEKKRGLEVDERIAKESAKRMVEVAKQGEIELKNILRKEEAQQRQLINEAKLEGIRKRNELIGQKGQKGFKEEIDKANKSLEKQGSLLTSLEKKLVGAFSGYQLARFAKEIVNIRGEFQGLELAFTTMLGSAEKSRQMMTDVTTLALETPYTVSEVANNTKQLIAMGIEADKVMATMKALGDVSAGLSVPMWRIAINYGQVSALGRLQAREIRDFAMAGVPIVEELAKQLGKTTGEITDLVSAGKIGFPEVEKAFQSMAGEGGKFHNMMEKQNSTVKGQMNRLEDQVELMMNAIGKSNEGVIYGAIGAASDLVENYENVGRVLLPLIASFGTYKAVLFLVTKGLAMASTAQGVYNTYLLSASISGSKFGTILDMLTVKFKSLNLATKASVIGAIAAAIVGIGFAIKSVIDESNKLEKALSKNLSSIKGTTDASVLAFDKLISQLKKTVAYSTEWNDTIRQINQSYGEYLPSLIEELDSYQKIEEKIKGVTAAIYAKAEAQYYSSSTSIIEENLTESLSKAYDNALASLTEKPFAGYDQLVLNKKDADLAIKRIFSAIKNSPEIYKETKAINALISSTLSDAYKGRDVDTSIANLSNFPQLDGLIKGVKAYSASWNEASLALENARSKQSIIFSNDNNYSRQIDDIANKYDVIANKLAKIPLTGGFDLDKAKSDNTIKMLEEMLAVYEQFGQHDKVREISKNIDTLKNASQEWRKALSKSLEGAMVVDKSTGILDVIEEMEKSFQEGRKLIDKQDPILIKWGLNYQTGEYKDSPDIPSVVKEQLDAVSKQIKKHNIIINAASEHGITLKEKNKRTPKDPNGWSAQREKEKLKYIRAAKDLEFQLQEEEISIMDEGSKKILAKMQLDYEKRKETLKRQQEDLLIDKKRSEREKGKKFDEKSVELSQEEKDKYRKLEESNDKKYQTDKWRVELEYMSSYLKEYGTFQQRKLAIAQEYDRKINAASDEWDKKRLLTQKQKALQGVDLDAIRQKIDWQTVFGDLTGVLESQLKETLASLRSYVSTEEFKTSSDTDKKTIYDAIDNLRNAITGGEGTLNIAEIQRQMNDLGEAINRLQTATLEEEKAYKALYFAQQEYDKALKTGSKTLIEDAKLRLDATKERSTKATNNKKNAESDVEEQGRELKGVAKDTIDGLELVSDGLHGFASKSLPSIFKGLQDTTKGLSKLNIGGEVGEAVGKLSKSISNAGFIGKLISAILSILDVLKDGIGTLVSNIIDTVLNAVNGILKNLLSGEMFVQIFDSLKVGIGNILNTVSFGGFNSLISSINGGNAKETASIISKLTISNEALKVSVDALRDEMKGNNGTKSIEAYNEAVAAQGRYNDNLKGILNAQMKYHNAHKSNSYYWNLDPKSLDEINKQLGTTLNNSWADFAELTPSQMNEIRKHLPDKWSEMINQGKYGDRFKEDWNNYADQAEKTEKLLFDLRENIAQVSFDSLRDNFLNSLMDMDKSAADFADDFEGYITKALLNFAIGDMLDEDLGNWYKGWADEIRNKSMTDEQLARYKDEYDKMVQDAIKKRDEIAKMTGYDNSEASKSTLSKGITGVTEDTANLLASYVNAIRADVAVNREQIMQIVRLSQLNQQSVGQMLAQIILIQVNTLNTANNTLRSADNTREIADIVRETNTLLKSATIPNGVVGWNLH